MQRITPAEARRAFTIALETLHDIDISPLKRLREEFYWEWRTLVLGPEQRAGQYTSSTQWEELDRTAPAIVERWASACKLLTPGSRSAPGWLADYGVEYLKKLRAVPLVSAQPPETEPPPSATPARVVGRGALFLPMPHPEPFPGEPWHQYRQRVCRVLRSHWDAAQKLPRQVKKPGTQDPLPSSATKIEHAQWFILYQCCGWMLAKIAACPWYQRRGDTGAERTIWEGIQGVANRTGLEVTRKRALFKKSVH
jgi:hypothetical protein